MNVDKAQLAAAANYLVQTHEYISQVREITEIVKQWGSRHVFFVGDRECLNALINLGLAQPEKLQQLYEIIQAKRKEMPDVRRNEYQRDFMARMRHRVSKALEVEALVHGKALTPAEKKKSEARLRKEWTTRKEQALTDAGEQDWKGRNAVTAKFWAVVDTELDKMLTKARQVLDKPVRHRKRVVTVLPRPPANRQMYDQLLHRKKS